MELQITQESNEQDTAYVRDKMFEYNMMHFPDDLKGRYQEVKLFLKDDVGHAYGGILGEICWNWMEIQYLFVEAAYRRAGYGKRLLAEAEKLARENGANL